jgi:monoamine oxidase
MSDAVAVIGAGVAGLSAARHLRAHGCDVIVLEARERIGGRLWTLYPDDLAVPIELGGEFLHGETPEIDAVAREAGLRSMDIAGRRFTSARGELRVMDDFWERLDRVMRRLDPARDPDRSFAVALERMRAVPSGDRHLARQFVEGFHAADTHLASESALADGGSPRGDVRERRIGRVIEGFGATVEALAAPLADVIRLRAPVTRIAWSRGDVSIDHGRRPGRAPQLRARAAIITVPLGVLQAVVGQPGAIAFDPPIPAIQRDAHGLAMGNVMKVVLRLDEPFWVGERFARKAGDERLDTLSFLHSRDAIPFPVWWTPYPIKAPVLVGWCGGPTASALSGMPGEELVAGAIDSLATVLGMTRRAVQRHVVSGFTHDWTSDPYARGAYSYVRVGGGESGKKLARPVEHTLFFAGEHADREGRNGTVHGAMASGIAAAKALLSAVG